MVRKVSKKKLGARCFKAVTLQETKGGCWNCGNKESKGREVNIILDDIENVAYAICSSCGVLNVINYEIVVKGGKWLGNIEMLPFREGKEKMDRAFALSQEIMESRNKIN